VAYDHPSYKTQQVYLNLCTLRQQRHFCPPYSGLTRINFHRSICCSAAAKAVIPLYMPMETKNIKLFLLLMDFLH